MIPRIKEPIIHNSIDVDLDDNKDKFCNCVYYVVLIKKFILFLSF